VDTDTLVQIHPANNVIRAANENGPRTDPNGYGAQQAFPSRTN